MEELNIKISKKDYETLVKLAGKKEFPEIQRMIKEAIKVYICNWIQYIPYIQKNPQWVLEEVFEYWDKQ